MPPLSVLLRPTRAGALFLGALAAACFPPQAFECDGDAACDLDGRAGRCIATGSCAYDDAACPSGWRYAKEPGRDASCVAILDDFEDGDLTLVPIDTRQGAWFTGGTPGGEALPTLLAEPRRERSTGALRLVGDAADDFYLAGFPLRDVGEAVHLPYDASAHTGLAFWARSGTPEPQEFLVKVWICVGEGPCADTRTAFGKVLSAPATWTRTVVPFASLEPVAPASTFDPAALEGIELASVTGGAFDLWIDDLVLGE